MAEKKQAAPYQGPTTGSIIKHAMIFSVTAYGMTRLMRYLFEDDEPVVVVVGAKQGAIDGPSEGGESA